MSDNPGIFSGLRRSVEIREQNNDYLRVCEVLQDFIYFDFWVFFLLLTPMNAFKTMAYVAEKGPIYVIPFVAAFGMIYLKSIIHVKDWVLKKWVAYKDF